MKGQLRRIIPVLVICIALGVAGCEKKPVEPEREPAVAPPVIKTAGELAVGVDLQVPPFAGTDEGQQAGLDIDVASALAEQLGLAVRFVDVPPSEAATALAQGDVDVMMSVPLSDASASAVALAGAYAFDGPAFFVSTGSTESVEPSLTIQGISTLPVAAQQGSEAYWLLSSELDPEDVKSYDTLRAALDDLVAGEVPVVAGDAFVGAYIMRDMPGVHFAGQLRPAGPLSVAVSADNVELGDAVRAALDTLAADGVFDAVRRKWVGDLPELAPATSDETPAAQ